MVVVNTKNDAQALLSMVGDDALHLSTSLCGEHRRDLLTEIRRRLTAQEPCLLVSTQVVEAGVDLDFPLVLRAMGPLDRIVQAAGRCNREGRLTHEGVLTKGRVVIFDPAEGSLPPGREYRTATDLTAMMLRNQEVDPNDPSTFTRYFRRLYKSVTLDGAKVQPARGLLDYPEVAERFQMIDEDGIGVIVRYKADERDQRVDDLIRDARGARGATRVLWRRAQPFMVSVRHAQFRRFERAWPVQVEELATGLWLWLPDYDLQRGLVATGLPPDSVMV